MHVAGFLWKRSNSARCLAAVAAAGAVVLMQPGAVGPAGAAPAKVAPARFATASTASTGGTFAEGTATADFTGDGRTDVAVAVSSIQPAAGLVVVRGNGRGGFSSRIDSPLQGDAGACDVAAGSLNGDAAADVAVSTCAGGDSPVLLMKGVGDGTFAMTQQLTVGSAVISHPAIGDLNGDGKGDVAVVREHGGLSVYFGKGDGTVGSPTDYPAMSSDSIRAVDVTGDGKLDLSFTGPATMVNEGNGTFGSPVGADFFAIGSAVVDLDGDGIPDGAGVDASGGHLLIGKGVGDGRYHLVRTLHVPALQTLSVAGGDFTADGVADLVVNGDGTIAWLYAGKGDFRVAKPAGVSTGPHLLRAADLDGASGADLISETSDPGTLYGVLGGNGALAASTLVRTKVPGEIALGDVNGDGHQDVATAGGILPKPGVIKSVVGVDLGRGGGRFASTKVSTLRIESAASGVGALALADVNHDGRLDAVGGFENFQFDPHNLFVVKGNGDGTFNKPLLTTTGDVDTDILAVAVADVTGDGKEDIVANTRTTLSVLPGKGDGTFKAPVLSGSGGLTQSNTLLGDVTGDGITDVVATIVTGNSNFSSSDLVVEQGDGAGHFAEVQRVHVDTNVGGAVLADLSGDGRPDLAVDGHGGTDGGRSGQYVLLDGANGALGAPAYTAIGGGSLVGADFNLDGSIDLATDAGGAGAVVELNKGAGQFVPGPVVVMPAGPSAAGDATDDGAADLLAGPFASPPAFALAANLTGALG